MTVRKHLQGKSMTRMRECSMWTPLFEGPLAVRALEVVREIAAEIRAGLAVVPSPDDQETAAADASLCGGRAGLAILYAYLARAGLDDGAVSVADALLDEAVETLAQVSMLPALYTGFTGVAWATSHLGRGVYADDDPHEEIDATLQAYLEQAPWTDDYDLVSGLVGIGVYALERVPRRSARALLGLVVDRLYDSAAYTPAGITWLTAPTRLPVSQRQRSPEGMYNCGVAHGVPGVIGLLGGALAAGIAPAQTQQLLQGAMRWLLSQRLSEQAGSTFPPWTGAGCEARPARSAWCYGDPGIAATMVWVAHGVGRLSWWRLALQIAQRAAVRPAEQAGIRDAGLCHGAAGLGHLFNRMYQATGAPALRDAALFWLRRTLEMRQPGCGIAGFAAHCPPGAERLRWMNNASLLIGAAGIALALLAAATPVEPAWDRMLLASPAPVARVHR